MRRRRQAAPKALIPHPCKHSRLPKLEELAISDNQIGDAGARALAAALVAGAAPRLRRLLLDHNKLGGGAAALGRALGGAARLASPPLAQARHTAATSPPPPHRLHCLPTHAPLLVYFMSAHCLTTTTTPPMHALSRSPAARAARSELQPP